MRYLIPAFFVVATLLVSCEDPVPQDYTRQVVVQAFLIVDEPVRDVKVYWSQALVDTFEYASAVITDAEVLVRQGAEVIPLMYVADSTGGRYEARDTTVLIQPSLVYSVEVRVGTEFVTGATTTPVRISWIKESRDTIQYPGIENELKSIDSLRVSWTSPGPNADYVLRMTCVDTVGYGEFLVPATADTNRRMRDEEFDRRSPLGRTPTRLVYLQEPNVFWWGAFKFFGKHEVTVFAGDPNFVNWFKQIAWTRTVNPLLGSVTGGLGVVGSASAIRSNIFIKKDKP